MAGADRQATAAPAWQPPQQIAEFRLVRPLGQGAMGQVFLYYDTVLDRPVAVKLIGVPGSPGLNSSSRQRFQVEARAIARLTHPNVVAIYQIGEAAGCPYLVSEFVRGQSLDKLDKPIPGPLALRLATGLARGLAAAHLRGVVHRDIKPANVILSDTGEGKLLDFGLAKLLDVLPGARSQPPIQTEPGAAVVPDSAVSLTQSAALLGTPRYMAPEAWRGEPVTSSADIYSLGGMLYELLSGHPPHQEATIGALRQAAQHRDAAPLAQAAPGVDPDLAAVVDRCLRREPEERFASGQELERALERLHDKARAVRARRTILAWSAAVLVGLLGVEGGVRWRERRQHERTVAAQSAAARATLDQARAANVQLAARRRAAAAAFDEGRKEAGEAAWAQVRQLDSEVRFTYAQASRMFEGALSLAPERPGLRRLFAEVLYERALLAEQEHAQIYKEDLLERLATLDDSGELGRRWARKAVVELSSAPAGALVLAARVVEDGSGPRRQETGHELGRTPLRVELAAGSYVLLLAPPRDAGGPTVSYPVRLERGETLAAQVSLPALLPEGFVYVPPGRFLYGTTTDEITRRGFLRAQPLLEARTAGYLIAVHETTYAEWIAYLRALPAAERAARLPGGGLIAAHGTVALREVDGRYELLLHQGPQIYRAREGEPLRYAGPPQGRDRRAVQDWLRFPVTGISCADAMAYTQWLRRSGLVPGARLCAEKEWERAARGADDREFPHGDVLLPDDANFDRTYGRRPLAFGPDEVGSHPASRSPFGVADMTGNAIEWVEMEGAPGLCALRGGGYYYGEATCRVTNRTEPEQSLRDPVVGLRVCTSYQQ